MNQHAHTGSFIQATLHDRRWLLLLLLITIAVIAIYFAKVERNPPGYYIDESSISYNAYTISQTGADEFGIPWPLYFRSFGDYKNPVYIYLLAGIYRITGPSILAARLLSAVCGVLAALALGLLATRISERREVGMLVALMALLTPWLFEMSRVVLEVALYPLIVALFLLCTHYASTRKFWRWREVVSLAMTLALLTYTYSIGRLIGPLFALGLVLFASRGRRAGVLKTWALYAIGLVPLLLFHRHNPGALSARFSIITYLEPSYTSAANFREFARHYLRNLNPWSLFVTGDPNFEQIAHIYGFPLLPAATGLLAIAGLALILRQHRSEGWWRFVCYCLLVSVVPASLTTEYVHMLRLAPVPVFVIVLTIPAIRWVSMRNDLGKTMLTLLLVLVLGQGAIFLWRFEKSANSARRLRQFDHGYPERILTPALGMTQRPVYLADALAIPGYIQAYWHSTLRGVPIANFVRLAPNEAAPDGALVITTEENCPRCRIISTSEFYTLYIASGPVIEHEPLPDGTLRASLKLISPVSVLPAGGKADFIVLVKNESNIVWPARERSGGSFQVSAGNHWLDHNGNMLINDDGRAALLQDLRPAQEVQLKLTVNAPKKPGSYLLEVDMLQEGVAWFGIRGSPTVRFPVKVE
ncbi:MAG TPA: glycosyltransferase family 39 protein [Pyrinomonadaceae bacterium]|nr:glycosyltransferase family 39 protein [Pyrinomonadaceae bacterium]